MMLDLIKKYGKNFKVTFSISGLAIEQFEKYAPEVIDSFKALAKTGCVEFLAETYSHSLASLVDEKEFKLQVKMHADLIKKTVRLYPCDLPEYGVGIFGQDRRNGSAYGIYDDVDRRSQTYSRLEES